MSNETKKTALPKLRFPEFQAAEEWEEKKLGGLTQKVGSGITPTGGDTNYKTEGLPFVRSQNIGWGKLLLDDIAFIDEKTHATFPATEINEHDVLLNITGASIGRCAVADSRVVGGNVNQHVCIIRTTEKLNPFFLSQYLIADGGQNQINSFQAGGNRQGLNFVQIRSFQIPLPSTLAEQQEIALTLSSLDDLIAVQVTKLAAFQAHKRGLMQRLFPAAGETVPKLRFREFQNSGEWVEKKLGQLGKLISGLTYSPNDVRESGLLVLRSSNVQHGKITLDDCVYVTPTVKGANLSKPNDILICVRNGSKALIGKNALIPDGIPLCTHGAFMSVFRAIYPAFVFQLFQSDLYNRQVSADLGATINSINGSQLLKYIFYVPEIEEQKKIADCLSSLDDCIAAQNQKIVALKLHKKGLMQRLFPSLISEET